MLTGRRPFAGEALYSVLYHQKHVQLDDPREFAAGVPEPLVGALGGAVEKERDARWSSASAFLAALDSPTAQHEWPASPLAGAGTVQVQRPGDVVPAESVVAIDWREAMAPEPLEPAPPSLAAVARGRRRRCGRGGARARRERHAHALPRREQALDTARSRPARCALAGRTCRGG